MIKTVCAVLLLLTLCSADLGALKTYLNQKEAQASNICSNIQQFYSNYLHDETKFCPSYESCSPTLEKDLGLTCTVTNGFGKDTDCGCSGSKISKVATVTKYLPSTDIKSKEIKAFNCFSSQIVPTYQNNSNDPNMLWQYIGQDSGALSSFPAKRWDWNLNRATGCFERGSCPQFDHRLRSWYVSGASTTKSIVMLIDASYHMGLNGRLVQAKKAVIEVIQGLTHLDKLSIVIIHNNITDCGNVGKLIPANHENKANFIQCVNSIADQTELRGDYNHAFQYAFDVLDATRDDNTCENAIIFLSAGVAKDGTPDPRPLILERNARTKAVIFNYGFGDDVDETIPMKIACDNLGLWFKVDEAKDDLVTILPSYYRYFLGKLSSKKTIWQLPYSDFLTGQQITSLSLGCYAKDETLLSVVSLDFLMSELYKIHGNLTEIQSEFISRGQGCSAATTIDYTYLDTLRGGHCNYCSRICSAGVTISLIFAFLLLGLVILVFLGVIFYLLKSNKKSLHHEENVEAPQKLNDE